MIAGYNRSRI